MGSRAQVLAYLLLGLCALVACQGREISPRPPSILQQEIVDDTCRGVSWVDKDPKRPSDRYGKGTAIGKSGENLTEVENRAYGDAMGKLAQVIHVDVRVMDRYTQHSVGTEEDSRGESTVELHAGARIRGVQREGSCVVTHDQTRDGRSVGKKYDAHVLLRISTADADAIRQELDAKARSEAEQQLRDVRSHLQAAERFVDAHNPLAALSEVRKAHDLLVRVPAEHHDELRAADIQAQQTHILSDIRLRILDTESSPQRIDQTETWASRFEVGFRAGRTAEMPLLISVQDEDGRSSHEWRRQTDSNGLVEHSIDVDHLGLVPGVYRVRMGIDHRHARLESISAEARATLKEKTATVAFAVVPVTMESRLSTMLDELSQESGVDRLAVLISDFKNTNTDNSDDPFGRQLRQTLIKLMAEDVRFAVYRKRPLSVGTRSVLKSRAENAAAQADASEAEFSLTGSYRRTDSTVQIDVELIKAGAHDQVLASAQGEIPCGQFCVITEEERLKEVFDHQGLGVQQNQFHIGVSTRYGIGGQTFVLGDQFHLHVYAERDCYLSLIGLDSEQDYSLLFPFAKDENLVSANETYQVPFPIQAQEPVGRDVLIVRCSTRRTRNLPDNHSFLDNTEVVNYLQSGGEGATALMSLTTIVPKEDKSAPQN